MSFLFNKVRDGINSWMNHTFSFFEGFEMQYQDIKPKIIIEPLLRENINFPPTEIEIYCFNGQPKIFQKIIYEDFPKVSVYDENFNFVNFKFKEHYVSVQEPIDDNIKKAVELSKILAEQFKLVRVDWLLYKDHLYFNEMTFTPFSGFILFPAEYKDWDLKLGQMLDIKRN